jgi:Ni/Co efflux regulator RcnB
VTHVTFASKTSLAMVLTLATAAFVAANAQEHEAHGGRPERPTAHGEPYPGPTHYKGVSEPSGWNARPTEVDHAHYNHNYQAPRVYHIGVYHRPPGWAAHRWAYGQVLPRAYWAAPYIIADYWLFALEVPPVGFEWVRDDTDAILVNVTTGQILQVEYGVFA